MMNSIELLGGFKMPLLGLGTFKIQAYDQLYKAIDAALNAGYRSFDTASVYRNETDIGKILKELLPKYNLERKDVFITSKLAPSEQGKSNARSACLSSIQRLGCDYLDLYLIHWPGTHKLKPSDIKHRQFRKESWLDIEELQKAGKVRSLGISNYLPGHIEELISYCGVKPSVLQVEYHPHLVQAGLKQVCDRHKIHLQAYSSLGTSASDNKFCFAKALGVYNTSQPAHHLTMCIEDPLLNDPVVQDVAHQMKKSPAQVLLRWAVQQGIGVLPKSTNPAHIVENADIFSFLLTDRQMSLLSQQDKQHHYCWNPAEIA